MSAGRACCGCWRCQHDLPCFRSETTPAPLALTGVALGIYQDVIRAMQNAEEMGGPEGAAYDTLMHKIAEECLSRRTARQAQGATAWHVHCRVSGGVTGTREGLLRHDGTTVVYPTRAAAEQAAATLNKKMNGRFSVASFHYHAVPAAAHATPATLPPSERCECEDTEHEDTEGIPFRSRTAHRYGAVPGAHRVRTVYGTFSVCYACYAAGHMQGELIP
jgi:hypothetical protein